jgi:hypothetical protein
VDDIVGSRGYAFVQASHSGSGGSFRVALASKAAFHLVAVLKVRTTTAPKRSHSLKMHEALVLRAVEALCKRGGADFAGKAASLEVSRVDVLLKVVKSLKGKAAGNADMLAGCRVDGTFVLKEVGLAGKLVATQVATQRVWNAAVGTGAGDCACASSSAGRTARR